MPDTNPAEKPVNDGGTNAPQQEPESDAGALLDAEALDAEKPANQGGGSD